MLPYLFIVQLIQSFFHQKGSGCNLQASCVTYPYVQCCCSLCVEKAVGPDRKGAFKGMAVRKKSV
jgi:hypothetical protein